MPSSDSRSPEGAAPEVPRPAPPRRGAHRRVSGPRREYLEAFEDRSFAEVPGPRGPGGPAGLPEERPAAPGRGPRPPDDAATRPTEPTRGGRGRTLTGITAAAVVTVLAVTVAGQVAEGERSARSLSGDPAHHTEERSAAEDAPMASESDQDGAESEGQSDADAGERGEAAAEPGFEQLLATVVDLDPALTASGELAPVGGSHPPADPEATTLLRYRVDVERGLDIDPEFFAEAVDRTLSDPRSWGNNGQRAFTRVSSGPHDFVITLASPGTTAEWCAKSGLDTTVQNVSCDSANTERVMINAWRWAQGAEPYGDDIAGYRQMLINHEVGHRIGYGHVLCPADGAPAPVMMQQTKSLASPGGATCAANPWPHPES